MTEILLQQGDIKNGIINGLGYMVIKQEDKKISFIGLMQENIKKFGVLLIEHLDETCDLIIGDFQEGSELRLDIKFPSNDFYISNPQDWQNVLTQITKRLNHFQASIAEKHPEIDLKLFEMAKSVIENVKQHMQEKEGLDSSPRSFYSCVLSRFGSWASLPSDEGSRGNESSEESGKKTLLRQISDSALLKIGSNEEEPNPNGISPLHLATLRQHGWEVTPSGTLKAMEL
jgi:hypothetical protein